MKACGKEWMVIMNTVSCKRSRVGQWKGRQSRGSEGLDVIREKRERSKRRKEEMNGGSAVMETWRALVR